MPILDWKHQTLIQSLLSRGPLKESEFHSIFTGVTEKNAGKNSKIFNQYIGSINKELAFVQFEVRACRNQYDGEIYYGVVNNIADEQSKLGTKYSIPQTAFFKAVVEAILEASAGSRSIRYMSALNICLDAQMRETQSSQPSSQVPYSFKNFSLAQKEKTLEELVLDGWLCFFESKDVGIGVRAFLDLRTWFRVSHEVPYCDVCNEAGIKAAVCVKDGCNARIHEYCLDKKFANNRARRVCPTCGTQWPYKDKAVTSEFKMEHVDEEVEMHVPSPDGIGSPAMTKRVRSCRARDSPVVDEVPAETRLPSRRITRRNPVKSEDVVPEAKRARTLRSSQAR